MVPRKPISKPLFIKRKNGINTLSNKTNNRLEQHTTSSVKKINQEYVKKFNSLTENNHHYFTIRTEKENALKKLGELLIKNRNKPNKLREINAQIDFIEKEITELSKQQRTYNATVSNIANGRENAQNIDAKRREELLRRLKTYNFKKGIYANEATKLANLRELLGKTKNPKTRAMLQKMIDKILLKTEQEMDAILQPDI